MADIVKKVYDQFISDFRFKLQTMDAHECSQARNPASGLQSKVKRVPCATEFEPDMKEYFHISRYYDMAISKVCLSGLILRTYFFVFFQIVS